MKALPAGDRLRLTVLNANRSAPLAGVKVTATTIRLMGEPLGESVTDAEGHCEVPRLAPAPGDFFYSLRAEREGYASMAASWSRFQKDEIADIPNDYELRLPAGTRIGGFVTDEEGRPAAGIQVKLHGAVFRAGPPPRQRARLNDGASEVTLTKPDGQWAWDRLPPDWEDIRLVFAGGVSVGDLCLRRQSPPTQWRRGDCQGRPARGVGAHSAQTRAAHHGPGPGAKPAAARRSARRPKLQLAR